MIIILLIIVCILIIIYSNKKEYLSIRRWRDLTPKVRKFKNHLGETVYITPRQVNDTWWDRNYNSGIGFQLSY